MIPDYAKPILEADAQAYVKRLAGWPYAGVAVEANQWAERKYRFAAEIWPKRHAACPKFTDEEGRPITWETRFKQMWMEPLREYRERLHAAKDKQASAA